MLYKELKNIDFVHYEPEKSIQRLKNEFGIDAPDSVIRQFYLDHRNNSSFIEYYGDINLYTIEWTLVDVLTEDLLAIGNAATYPDFIEEISNNAMLYNKEGDIVIDSRDDVIQWWKNHGTWKTPPIFLDGTKLKKPTKKLHLVEGHTRLGNLKGIFTEKVFKLANFHKIYYGKYKIKALNF